MNNEELQKTKYCSFESQNPHWVEGQERYLHLKFKDVDRDACILDAACGDGVGLKVFKEMGFKNVVGIEFNPVKAAKAREYEYLIFENNLEFKNDYACNSIIPVDICYSSHTLEHLEDPAFAIQYFKKSLNHGYMLIVLPYPDTGPDDAHCGKFALGTNINDGGKTVCEFFEKQGLKILEKEFDSFREPEIWLKLSL